MNRIIETLILEKLIKSNLWPNTLIVLWSATSAHFLNSCRDGDCTASLGTLLQCLTTLSGKKFFLISSLNLHWQNLKPFPLALLIVIWKKRPTCSSTTVSFLWQSHPTWCHLHLDWVLGDTSCDWPLGLNSIQVEVMGFIQRWQN